MTHPRTGAPWDTLQPIDVVHNATEGYWRLTFADSRTCTIENHEVTVAWRWRVREDDEALDTAVRLGRAYRRRFLGMQTRA